MGRRTILTWNARNLLVRRTDALGGTANWTYDADGNLLTATDPIGRTTVQGHDAMQQLAAVTDPVGRETTLEHDPMGRITLRRDPDGTETRITWDARGRMFSMVRSGPAGTAETRYSWDSGDRLTAAVESPSGQTIEQEWDDLDRLVVERSATGRIESSYDAAGRRLEMRLDGGEPTRYRWDAEDRLAAVERGMISVAFDRDAAGRIVGTSLPGDVTERHRYDGNGALVEIASDGPRGPLLRLGWTRGPDGRPASAHGRAVALPAAVPSATYDDADQLVAWGERRYAHDAAGRVVDDGIGTLRWNASGRLAEVSGDPAAAYVYDPFGRRIEQETGTGRSTMTFDGIALTRWTDETGASTTALVGDGGDDLLAISVAGTTYAVLRDDLGSVVALVAPDGSLAEMVPLTPYGAGGGAGPGFLGRPADATGLIDLRARVYDPGTGRFLSPDPISLDGYGLSPTLRPEELMTLAPDGLPWLQSNVPLPAPDGHASRSTYAYADGDPVTGADPMGMLPGLGALTGKVVGKSIVGTWFIYRAQQEAINYENGRWPLSDLFSPSRWTPSGNRHAGAPPPAPAAGSADPTTPTSASDTWGNHDYSQDKTIIVD
jgi:RHS repeat-associated protein